jgi:hydrogenase maturation factor HypF (carbamoyltransferase family)
MALAEHQIRAIKHSLSFLLDAFGEEDEIVASLRKRLHRQSAAPVERRAPEHETAITGSGGVTLPRTKAKA